MGSSYAFICNPVSSLWIGDGSASLGCSSESGFTVSFWLKTPTSYKSWQDFFGFRVSGTDYRFEYTSAGNGTFDIYNCTTGASILTDSTKIKISSDAGWTHVALVFTDSSSLIYTNAIQACRMDVSQGNLKHIIAGALVRGSKGAVRNTGANDTCIDELAIFDFAATEDEVKKLAEALPEIFVSYDVEVGRNQTVISEDIDVDLPVFNFSFSNGLSSGLYKVAEIKGDRSFDEDVLKRAYKPDDSKAKFFLANGNKEIYCAYANDGDHVWIGGKNGDLCTYESWWPVHQSGGHCFIDCPVESELAVSGNFTPASLTFGQNSKAVVISGEGKISDVNWGNEGNEENSYNPNNTGIDAITNLSNSASHTINVPVYFESHIQVKQAAHSGKEEADREKAHVTFAGGAYSDKGWFLDGSDNPDYAYSRVMFGAYYLNPPKNQPWMVEDSKHRVALAKGSSLYVPYVKTADELFVDRGAMVNINDYIFDYSDSKLFNRNYGTVIISNLTVKKCSSTLYTSNGHNYNDVPSVFKVGCVTNAIETGAWFVIGAADHSPNCTNILFVGSGGLHFKGQTKNGASPVYSIGFDKENALTIIRPWYSDFEIAQGTGSGHALVLCRDVEFNTNDEEGIGRTITVNAAVKRNNGDMTMTIAGSGTLQMNKGIDCTDPFPVAVSGTSTLALGSGVKFPNGKVNISSGATLKISESGTTEVKELAFEEGATLVFNFSNKALAPTLNVTGGNCALFEELSNVRIGGIKPSSGDYTLMTVKCSNYEGNLPKIWQAASGSADWVGKIWLEPVVGDSGSINAVTLKMRRKVGFALHLR